MEGHILLNKAAKAVVKWRKSQGLHTPSELGGPNNRTYMQAKLMEASIRIGRAAEAAQDDDFDAFSREVGASIIWLLDIGGSCGVDIQQIFDDMIAKGSLKKTKPLAITINLVSFFITLNWLDAMNLVDIFPW
jgi:hypothetical protein